MDGILVLAAPIASFTGGPLGIPWLVASGFVLAAIGLAGTIPVLLRKPRLVAEIGPTNTAAGRGTGRADAAHLTHRRRERITHMTDRMPKKAYEDELRRLQAELVDMQAWVQATGARIVVIFEGRDAAGKGSTIKRVSEYLNPRVTASSPCPPRPSARRRSGTSSATSRICPPPARSSSWTAPGTTAPVSSG